MKYWMMAYTANPQFVVGRSVTCTASGALCLLSAAALAEAMMRSYVMVHKFNFCKGESDYKWSSTVILISQTVAVGIGVYRILTRFLASYSRFLKFNIESICRLHQGGSDMCSLYGFLLTVDKQGDLNLFPLLQHVFSVNLGRYSCPSA